MTIGRRGFVKRAVGGATLTLAFELGGTTLLLTPKQARAQAIPLQQLSSEEGRILGRLADALLPGAAEGGVTHFIDHQLGVDPDDCMLIAKFFEVPPPYIDFYRQGLAQCAELAQQTFAKQLAELTAEEMQRLAGLLFGPEAPTALFYLSLRSDAVDVVYGTPEGFEKLNVPYMAHIMPPEGWDG
jgi:hypothetical protein